MPLHNAPIPEAVTRVLGCLKVAGHEAFLVGGCVRDMLRGLAPKDFDVTTSARPEEVQRLFPKVIPTGLQHGTVTVLSSGEHVEVTTFRSEGAYVDGRRPSSVEFHSDVEADLARRDFTINAMAFDPVSPRLVDPFGGQRDLAAGLIRAVGEPHERFSEDGLRPLRAVRFAAVLGFELDRPTEAAIRDTLHVFRKVSVERMREELVKLLMSDRAELGLTLLHRTGLLEAFLPEVAPEHRFLQACQAVRAAAPSVEVRLAALLHPLDPPMLREVLERLRFSNKTLEAVEVMARYQGPVRQPFASDASRRRLVANMGVEFLERVLQVAESVEGRRMPDVRADFQRALAGNPPLNAKALALNGSQIMAILGVGPSPSVGAATRYLMEQVLENPQLNTAQALTQMLIHWSPEQPR